MREKLNCIMVIDDDEPTNFISTMLIEEADCTKQLQVIDGGRKALAYLQKAIASGNTASKPIPELIFLDINMPCMNGWEFLEQYKKLDKKHLGHPVIIMLTTSFSPEDKLRAGSIGEVAGFENKPLTAEMIQRVLHTYFKNEHVGQDIQSGPLGPTTGLSNYF